MNRPLVSVVMPVYNGARFLPEALASVFGNGYEPLQVLVVDDGSSDETASVARGASRPIEVLERPNGGPAAARNTALRAAVGRYVSFLDVDDRWPAGRLMEHVSYLEAHPGVEIAQGLVSRLEAAVAADGHIVERRVLRPYRFVNLGSATFRKEVFDKVGLFDETLRFAEDADWMVRAWELGAVKHVLPAVALDYRIHGANMTCEAAHVVDRGLPRLLYRWLVRRREGREIGPAGVEGLRDYAGWTDLAAAEAEHRAP